MKRLWVWALIAIFCLFMPSAVWGVAISDLPALTTVATGDMIAIVDVSPDPDATSRITWGELMGAPGAIGGTTPAAGAFTSLQSTTYGSDGSITDAEFLYINTLSSNAQTQFGTKAPISDPTFTGEIGIGSVNVSETELGILEGATLTTTEINYVDDVTSSIQTQLNGKAATTRKLDDFGTPDDNTDLNATTTYHGLLPKLNNSAVNFLNGQGSWVTPAGAGNVSTSGTPVANDIARFTSGTDIEGRSYAEFKADLDLEIGTDILAQQTIGIADDNLLEVDQADAASGEYGRFTANGLESRSIAEVKSDLKVMVEETVADEAEITLATGVSGWGFAQAGDNEEWIQFCFTAAGVVTVISNSANAVNTDTDGDLCVYDAGSGIAIKNRLGASKTIRYSVNYSS